MPRRIQLIDLFSGIAGFSLALRSAFKTVLYCEINPTCQCVLKTLIEKMMIDPAPIHPDIRTLHIERYINLTSPTMLSLASPCVDVSIMNRNRVGITGPRSSLIFEIFRIIDAHPLIRGVIMENSPLMTNAMDDIAQELTSRGFKMAWGNFSASDVGAPHIRKRWYCIAVRNMRLPPLDRIETNWSHEPVSRIVPRSEASHLQIRTRAAMLGNAVVPACVQFAYLNLVDILMKSTRLTTSKTSRPISLFLYSGKGVVQIYDRQISSPNRPVPFSIQVRYGRKRFEYTAFATPVTQLRPCTTASSRTARMLASQILHDVATLEQARNYTGKKYTSFNVHNSFSINPEFIEWMMGYPCGWTECTCTNLISSEHKVQPNAT